MGYWGVKSYENDRAHDALDGAFDRVHGAVYETLMDDRNPLTQEQVQSKLANSQTLEAALELLSQEGPRSFDDWNDELRLAYAGVVVRHLELKVIPAAEVARRALDWLKAEDLEWDEQTLRDLRRNKEIESVRRVLTGRKSFDNLSESALG